MNEESGCFRDDDFVKNLFDSALHSTVKELRRIEQTARECSKITGYRSDGLRLQAGIIENMRAVLQDVLDRGGMPSLNDINRVMNAPVTMIFPKEALDTESLQRMMSTALLEEKS